MRSVADGTQWGKCDNLGEEAWGMALTKKGLTVLLEQILRSLQRSNLVLEITNLALDVLEFRRLSGRRLGEWELLLLELVADSAHDPSELLAAAHLVHERALVEGDARVELCGVREQGTHVWREGGDGEGGEGGGGE